MSLIRCTEEQRAKFYPIKSAHQKYLKLVGDNLLCFENESDIEFNGEFGDPDFKTLRFELQVRPEFCAGRLESSAGKPGD